MPKQCRVDLDFAANEDDDHGQECCAHSVAGPGSTGSPDVLVNGKMAMRQGDPGKHGEQNCDHGDTFVVKGGSSTVFFNDRPAARQDDATMHCGGTGNFIMGSPDVMVGGADISPNDD